MQETTDAMKLAMAVVNQLFDIAEVPVEKRQAINDNCDKYVFNIISPMHRKMQKWDDLDKEISGCYYDKDDNELPDDEGGDLCTIGELAAAAFGYL